MKAFQAWRKRGSIIRMIDELALAEDKLAGLMAEHDTTGEILKMVKSGSDCGWIVSRRLNLAREMAEVKSWVERRRAYVEASLFIKPEERP